MAWEEITPSTPKYVSSIHSQCLQFDTKATGPAYIRVRLQLARGPLDPLITAILDQPPGQAVHSSNTVTTTLTRPLHTKGPEPDQGTNSGGTCTD